MLRVWQSFSCNNSTSFRLVARFADAAIAATTAAELRGLLADFDTPRASGLEGLARVYGFDWGDGGMGDAEDGPAVVTDDKLLIVQHAYCLGLGPGVPAYLREHGAASVDKETTSYVHVSVLFRASPDPRLDDELAAVFAQLADNAERVVSQFRAPWIEWFARGRIAFFRDAGSAGLFFPTDARDIARLRTWLAERGIDNPVIRIEEYADQDLYVALAAARCTACTGPLEYLDPRLHDIESPQLVCKPCGGLYELSAFVTS